MKNVMDFLVSDSSDNRLEMIPDSSSKTSTFTLAAGSTFLAVDTTPDSISKPLFTANPDSRLDPGTTMDFAATQGLVYVHEPDSTVAAAKFYLEAVPGTDGKTKMLKWCADQVACEKAGAIWVALVRVDGATKAVL